MSQKHLQYLPAYTSSTHALDLDCLLSIYPLLPDMFNELLSWWSDFNLYSVFFTFCPFDVIRKSFPCISFSRLCALGSNNLFVWVLFPRKNTFLYIFYILSSVVFHSLRIFILSRTDALTLICRYIRTANCSSTHFLQNKICNWTVNSMSINFSFQGSYYIRPMSTLQDMGLNNHGVWYSLFNLCQNSFHHHLTYFEESFYGMWAAALETLV